MTNNGNRKCGYEQQPWWDCMLAHLNTIYFRKCSKQFSQEEKQNIQNTYIYVLSFKHATKWGKLIFTQRLQINQYFVTKFEINHISRSLIIFEVIMSNVISMSY